MGRLPSKSDLFNLSYIAGFLDADGSIMLQVKRRNDNGKVRVKTVICFYQDHRHKKEIDWIKSVLKCGYTYLRNDDIYELRIEGFTRTYEVLAKLKPYIRFKSRQAKLMLKLIPQLGFLKEEKLIENYLSKMHKYNYYSSQRRNVPVTTESIMDETPDLQG